MAFQATPAQPNCLIGHLALDLCKRVMHCPLALLPSLSVAAVALPTPPSHGLLSNLLWQHIPKCSCCALNRITQPLIALILYSPGCRISCILKHLFPVPKDDSKRVISFANQSDYVSFRHHTFVQPKGANSVELTEVRHCNRARLACTPIITFHTDQWANDCCGVLHSTCKGLHVAPRAISAG